MHRHDRRVPRKPRLQFAGGFFHVYGRGVRREPIFRDDEDRQYFLNLLGVITDRQRWLVLAYCLMTNHFHLLLETPEPNLSTGMHRQLGGYAQWFNERHAVEGHVFERRFQSVVAKDDAQLLELMRYIVLNPVRAGVCWSPGEHRWSSFRPTAGLSPVPRCLARQRALSFFRGPGGPPELHFERFVTADPACAVV
jgi:REP element-mobilizing transposase RayT